MMTGGQIRTFWMGFWVGVSLTICFSLLNADDGRAATIQKYKSGEIVCAELNNELICRSVK